MISPTIALKQRLKELDPETFHDLCFQVLSSRFPTLGIRRVGGKSGDEGVDIFEGQLEGHPCIWQSKFFPDGVREPQKKQIRKSLRRALQNFTPRFWVLCVPVELDIKAHRWFQRFQKSYGTTVAVGLFDGPDIVTHLFVNRVLRNTFFPNVVLDVQAIKAELFGISKFSTEELEKVTAENVEEYVQRLEDKDPRFAFQVTFPSAEEKVFPDSVPDRLVLSVFDGEKRVDAFARDVEALSLDPPTFSGQIVSKPAIGKFIKAIKTGEEAEFGADELGMFRTSMRVLMPPEFQPTKFVMSTPEEIRKKRFSFRITFKRAESVITYELLEFGVVRKGTDEIELATLDNVAPLQMRLVVRSDSTGSVNVRWRWVGKEVRSACKAMWAVRIVTEGEGGQVEFYDLKREQRLFVAGFPPGVSRDQVSDEVLAFVQDVAQVADAFGATIILKDDLTDLDLHNLHLLRNIMRDGCSSVSIKQFSMTLTKGNEPIDSVIEATKEEKQFRIELSSPPPLMLFGTPVETGPCIYYCRRATVADPEATAARYRAANEGEGVSYTLRPLEPLEVSFPKFMKPSRNS